MASHNPMDDRDRGRTPSDEDRRPEAAGSPPGRIEQTAEEPRPGQVRNEAHQDENAKGGRGVSDSRRPAPDDVSKTVEGSRGENIRK